MKKLDWVASSIILITTLLLAGVIFVGNRVPITITCQMPNACAQVGPFGSVVFEFSRSVQRGQVEALWQTVPPFEGKWEWLDDRHVRWASLKPLPSDQKIALQFSPGPLGQNGEQIGSAVGWEVTVRSPRILAARYEGEGQEIFSYGLEAGSPAIQISHTQGRVFDYQTSPDGETIIFSVMNDLSGIDLWIVQRGGENPRKLLDCGADRCSTPTWSPVLPELAYTREGAGFDPNGPKGAPRIWILDFTSGQTVPLLTDPQKIGYGPKWSPDGQWLSIWNGAQGGIQVVNKKTGETFLLESSNGDAGCWKFDSQFLYYSNMVAGESGFRNVLFRADIANGSTSTILGGNTAGGGLSVDSPACSPTEKWVVVTIQPDVKTPQRTLFLLNPDGRDGISLMDEGSRIPGFYTWTPDGNQLVFQIDVLGGEAVDVEIWVWERSTGKAKKITVGGRSPQWLP